jgi:hypothetical protein
MAIQVSIFLMICNYLSEHYLQSFFSAQFICIRVPELSDAAVFRGMQLKHLTEKIEHELYRYYGGVNSLYQRKYRALVHHLTDSNNEVNFFHQIIGISCKFHRYVVWTL